MSRAVPVEVATHAQPAVRLQAAREQLERLLACVVIEEVEVVEQEDEAVPTSVAVRVAAVRSAMAASRVTTEGVSLAAFTMTTNSGPEPSRRTAPAAASRLSRLPSRSL
jgi:hypothetical protein